MARALRIGTLLAVIASTLVVVSAAPAVAAPGWAGVTSGSPVGAVRSSFAGVACPSSTNCLAVGQSGLLTLAQRWNGTEWTQLATPQADWTFGAPFTYLTGIACASATKCFAVGLGAGSEVNVPLIDRWNGSGWSTVATSGLGTGFALNAVACVSGSVCHAVGNDDSSLFATRWNGSSWSKVTIPTPAGAANPTLSSIKCTAAKNCIAVGSYNAPNFTKTLVERWNGTKWSIVASPNPAGALASFTGVACPATTTCFAVGTYTLNKTHQQRTLVERWNGTKWTIVASPNAGAHPVLNSAACRSISVCTAVGTKGTATLVERWNGTKWTIAPSPNAAGASSTHLTSVVCPSATVCIAAGSGLFAGDASPRAVSERWNGSAWKVQASAANTSDSPLHGVGCATASLCFAAGTYVPRGAPSTRAFLATGGAIWSQANAPVPAGATVSTLGDVTCASSTFCVAVGSATTGTEKTLIDTWNGSVWTVAGGAVAGSLSGVACADVSHCVAVGSNGGNTLVEQWSGSAWSTASGAVPGALDSVSCGDPTHCMAVGVINGPNAPVLELNGSTWTAINGIVPSGSDQEITATGVACTAAADCMLVGHSRDMFNRPSAFAGHWNGTAWSQVSMPVQGFGSLAEDITCVSSGDCTAVGSYFPNHGGPVTAVEHWDGTTWTTVANPNPPMSPPGDTFEGVACTGASNCFAVGGWTEQASTRTLVEHFA